MKEFWSEKAKRLTPYTAGEQPTQTMIKLNTNENAYPPSPKVKEAIMEAAGDLRPVSYTHLSLAECIHDGVAFPLPHIPMQAGCRVSLME